MKFVSNIQFYWQISGTSNERRKRVMMKIIEAWVYSSWLFSLIINFFDVSPSEFYVKWIMVNETENCSVSDKMYTETSNTIYKLKTLQNILTYY